MICQVPVDQTQRFRSMIARSMGLRFDDKKLTVLAELLERRSRKLNCDAETYLWRLEFETSSDEWAELARELTIGETYFFRNYDQFDALAEIAIPERLRLNHRHLRFLSAGCSSGEEAYSIAMIARKTIADPSIAIDIHAADVNPAVIEKARRARYSAWALRETPPEMREKWFRREGNEMLLEESIKKAVAFESANLASDEAPIWRPGAYDVIFCRNVLMYFEIDQMRAAIARIARALAPGGFLFLGHAETLRSISERFNLCNSHEAFYYQLKDGAAAAEERVIRLVPRSSSVQQRVPQPFNDAAWVDEIRLASERVAALVPWPDVAPAVAPPAVRTFDSTPVLELLRKERFAEALDAVREGATSATDPELLLLEATLLINGGQLAAAEEAAQRLLEIDGNNTGAYYVLGLCGEHRGATDRAVMNHRAAARLDGGFAMPHLHLGLLARRAGDLKAARREFTLALALLEREDARRILMFGGGFNREALMALCSSTLAECEVRT